MEEAFPGSSFPVDWNPSSDGCASNKLTERKLLPRTLLPEAIGKLRMNHPGIVITEWKTNRKLMMLLLCHRRQSAVSLFLQIESMVHDEQIFPQRQRQRQVNSRPHKRGNTPPGIGLKGLPKPNRNNRSTLLRLRASTSRYEVMNRPFRP